MFDPEHIHDVMVNCGKRLGNHKVTRKITAYLFDYQNPKLSQNILGIQFKNPIGLAAGFDKDAKMMEILPSIGFGFGEIGSITARPYAGNKKPRLKRLIESKSIVVNYGLKNEGAKVIRERVRRNQVSAPTGISIARSNDQETAETERGIADYLETYKLFGDLGNFDVINISCPNAYGGCSFMDPPALDKLLEKLGTVPKKKPVFLKLSPDVLKDQIGGIIEVARKHSVDGFVCSNLTKNRNNPKILEQNIPAVGGLSGKVVSELSNDLIRYIYSKTKGKFVIIGCGGIFSARDAYKKIRLGASLIELITGMIFEGPQLISEINQGLVSLLEKDGYKNISEAIGADVK